MRAQRARYESIEFSRTLEEREERRRERREENYQKNKIKEEK